MNDNPDFKKPLTLFTATATATDTDTVLISDTEVTPMITPSDIIEFLFCPRFVYYMHCLNIDQHEEQRYKVMKGREVHNDRAIQNKDYLRKKIGCVDKDINVYLASVSLHVRGVVDEVLYLSDGTMAPLDYKLAEYRDYTFNTHKYQSVLYAMLIRETYQREVKKGYIYYLKGDSKLKEIDYNDNLFAEAREIIDEIFQIMTKGYYPKKRNVSAAKCIDCCYKNICVH